MPKRSAEACTAFDGVLLLAEAQAVARSAFGAAQHVHKFLYFVGFYSKTKVSQDSLNLKLAEIYLILEAVFGNNLNNFQKVELRLYIGSLILKKLGLAL